MRRGTRWRSLLVPGLLAIPGCGSGGSSGPVPSALDGTGGQTGEGELDPDTRLDGMSGGELAIAFDMLRVVNDERRAANVQALDWHDQASWASYAHAVDMQEFDFFGEVNPHTGTRPFDRVRAVGVTGLRGIDEIVATGPTSAPMLIYAIMSSPTHRERMLDPDWTFLSVGVHAPESGNVFWTLDFLAR